MFDLEKMKMEQWSRTIDVTLEKCSFIHEQIGKLTDSVIEILKNEDIDPIEGATMLVKNSLLLLAWAESFERELKIVADTKELYPKDHKEAATYGKIKILSETIDKIVMAGEEKVEAGYAIGRKTLQMILGDEAKAFLVSTEI